MLKHKNTTAAALAFFVLSAPLSAHADATFGATIAGAGTYFDYFNQCTPAPDSPFCDVSWSGSFSAKLSSGADGTYTGASLESLSFQSNWTVENYHAGDTQTFYDFGPVGPQPGVSVTILGGRISAISFDYDDWESHLTVDGLSAHAWSDCRDGECDAFSSYDVSGTLTPDTVSSVPELSNGALLVAGLGLAILGRRRRALG